MSKIFPATASMGVVKFGEFPIPEAQILGKGVGPSEGVLFIDEERVTYLPKSVDDLETTITELVNAVEVITDTITLLSTMLASIGAGMTGPTTSPPPTLPADLIQLSSKATELTVVSTQLENLRSNLK